MLTVCYRDRPMPRHHAEAYLKGQGGELTAAEAAALIERRAGRDWQLATAAGLSPIDNRRPPVWVGQPDGC